jgi:uncharacterized protein
MEKLGKYCISLSGLDSGKEYSFSFVADDDFFADIQESRFFGGKIDVNVNLIKRSSSYFLDLSIIGELKVPCSRCLELFVQTVEFKDNIEIELGEETNFDTNKSFVTLDRNAEVLNIRQFIYEFCDFALPLRNIHPDDNEGESVCDPEMIKLIDKYSEDNHKTDPRWDKLKEIMN